jgi:zinc protease
MNVATTAFGGTFTAPLMHEIREVRGWSYGAYASVAELRGRGGFSMVSAPSTADTVPCIELMVDLYKKYWNGEYPESLFEFGRSYMSNQYPFSVATADARVSEYLHAELMGYPDNWVQSYPTRLAALRLADIKAMPKRYLSDTDFIIVIVASYKELKTALAGLSFTPEIKVLPIGSEP